MFDEYLEPPRAKRPGSPAQAVQVPVTSAGTPLSTTIDQDTPSPYISPSSSDLQSHSLPPGVVVEPHFMEDHNVAPIDNNPFVNVFAPEPYFKASSSGEHPLDNVIGNPSRPAPWAWYDTLLRFLLDNNFSKGTVDPTLFTRKTGKHILPDHY
nr:uncharacterized mitochondrial protein AtMg00810-like [Tanacetum cinerariifolium]